MKLLTALYATVTFLSALLLFLLEPIAARQLLPLFGGSAAVWTTCLVFFQCALLAGYLYAHLLATRLSPRTQAVTHIFVLTAAILSLQVHVRPNAEAVTWHPILALLWLLTATIGLPFLTLASTSPLLQSWRAHANQQNPPPWWLYALSNAGSLLALLLYPSVVEPTLTLRSQVVLWGLGFLHLRRALRSIRPSASAKSSDFLIPANAAAPESAQPQSKTSLLWILLPAAPQCCSAPSPIISARTSPPSRCSGSFPSPPIC